jgi:hypothetical protein
MLDQEVYGFGTAKFKVDALGNVHHSKFDAKRILKIGRFGSPEKPVA